MQARGTANAKVWRQDQGTRGFRELWGGQCAWEEETSKRVVRAEVIWGLGRQLTRAQKVTGDLAAKTGKTGSMGGL